MTRRVVCFGMVALLVALGGWGSSVQAQTDGPTPGADPKCPGSLGGIPSLPSEAYDSPTPSLRTLICTWGQVVDGVATPQVILYVNWVLPGHGLVPGGGAYCGLTMQHGGGRFYDSSTNQATAFFGSDTDGSDLPVSTDILDQVGNEMLRQTEQVASPCQEGGPAGENPEETGGSGGGIATAADDESSGVDPAVIAIAVGGLLALGGGALGLTNVGRTSGPQTAAGGATNDVMVSGQDAIDVLLGEGWIQVVGLTPTGQPIYRTVGDLQQFNDLPQFRPRFTKEHITPNGTRLSDVGAISFEEDAQGNFTDITIVAGEGAVPPSQPDALPDAPPPLAPPATYDQFLADLARPNGGRVTVPAANLPGLLPPDKQAWSSAIQITLGDGVVTVDTPLGQAAGTLSIDADGRVRVEVTEAPPFAPMSLEKLTGRAQEFLRPINEAIPKGLKVTEIGISGGEINIVTGP